MKSTFQVLKMHDAYSTDHGVFVDYCFTAHLVGCNAFIMWNPESAVKALLLHFLSIQNRKAWAPVSDLE